MVLDAARESRLSFDFVITKPRLNDVIYIYFVRFKRYTLFFKQGTSKEWNKGSTAVTIFYINKLLYKYTKSYMVIQKL